jgi:hypothetical protein
MHTINLSFCIPTYNRAASVSRLVKDILKCEDPDIEVVVLDNGSSDNTLEVLRTVSDPRLLVRSNGENKGALFNMVNVMAHGKGTFSVYSTDQDYIDPTRISAFKTLLLSHPGLACGYCLLGPAATAGFSVFPKGYAAMQAVAFKGYHPTGYFFRSALLQTIRLVENFSNYGYVDLFPLDFAFGDMAMLGDAGICAEPIFSPETGRNVVEHKSSTTHGNSKTAFFVPESRLKLTINYSHHAAKLGLPAHQQRSILASLFVRGLSQATLGYRSVMGNEALCVHYRMDRRNVPFQEMLLTGWRFYRVCKSSTAPLWASSQFIPTEMERHAAVLLWSKVWSRIKKIKTVAPALS